MLQNAYFLVKIGADAAENEQYVAEICQKLATTLRVVGTDVLPALDLRRRLRRRARRRARRERCVLRRLAAEGTAVLLGPLEIREKGRRVSM